MKRYLPLLFVTLLAIIPAQGDGGGDGYSFHGGGSDVISTRNAGQGQAPIMGPVGKIVWTDPASFTRANYNVTPVKVQGDVGYYRWSMPEQGNGYKKLLFMFQNYSGSQVQVINFPTPFDQQPLVTNTTGLTVTIDTSSITIQPGAAAVGGSGISIEGF